MSGETKNFRLRVFFALLPYTVLFLSVLIFGAMRQIYLTAIGDRPKLE